MNEPRSNSETPCVVLIAGPNGAGKSTLAPYLLKNYLGIKHFVNPDIIASGLSAYQSDVVALQAGRIMLERLKELANARNDFAFETTLASRTYARWLKKPRTEVYRTHPAFVWLSSEELAIDRVAKRVERGGRNIPEETIRRRYHAGLKNLKKLYLDNIDHWMIIDGTRSAKDFELIATGKTTSQRTVYRPDLLQLIEEAWS